ncbi:MAG: hypothetical protein LBM70_01050 [Victivallales bacterium]|jgi:hypothetical protein|nr:hypothetical protein [Victivallales bacterium]
MSQKKRNRSGEHGAAIFEAVAALLVLCLIFFGMLQIFHWCVQNQVCEYAAFYTAKSAALGYRPNMCLRAARVAAISISGKRRGRSNSSEKSGAESYMVNGDSSGVYYQYWYPQKASDPELFLTAGTGPMASGSITLLRAPLLGPGFAALFGIAENPEPAGRVQTYNYSRLYME